MFLMLSLALSLFSTPSQASVPPLAAISARLVASAAEDVSFLDANVENCTRYAGMIRQFLVTPIATDLHEFAVRLARYSDAPARACAARADLDFILGTLAQKLALASSPQSQLMGMSGDEAMIKSLSWDESHPACRADDSRDPKSTRELKAYFSLKLKLISLRASVNALKNQTDCQKRE